MGSPATDVSKSSPGHGGRRPGAGRKPKTEQNDAYTILAKAKAKRETYLAQLAELEYKKAAGELIPADLVQQRWQTVFANVRSRLLSIPSQIAATCENAPRQQIENKAGAIIRQALEELSSVDS